MAPSISPSIRSVFIWSSASCSLILLMAKPTWMSTQSPGDRLIVLQQAEIDPAAHADDIDERRIRIVGRNLDNLPWYG